MDSLNDNLLKRYIIRAHIPGHNDCLTEHELGIIWETLCSQQREKILFYDGQISSKEEFIQFMQCDTNYVYVLMQAEMPLVFAWVNNFFGKCGMIHFTTFYNLEAENELNCLFLLRFLLFSQVGGEYCFDALYGLTPKVYRHVLPFITKLGFRLVADIPSAIFFQKKGKKCPKSAVLSLVTRDTVNTLE